MEYLLALLIVATIYVIFALSLNFELEYGRLFNFGPAAFFGIGAWLSAEFSLHGFPASLSICIAIAAAGAAGILIAAPALHSREFFGIVTLSFAETVHIFLSYRLSEGGLTGIPRPFWIAEGVAGLPLYLAFSILLAVLVFLVLRYIARSPFGRILRISGERHEITEILGRNTTALELQAFVLGSAAAGLAGAMWAHYSGSLDSQDFTIMQTVLVFLCVILGGRGTAWGPVLGAVAVVVLGEAMRYLLSFDEATHIVMPVQGIFFGVLLLVLIFRRPSGILVRGEKK